jgi:hypothetical protein
MTRVRMGNRCTSCTLVHESVLLITRTMGNLRRI